jgi:predicted Zn-dependent protease
VPTLTDDRNLEYLALLFRGRTLTALKRWTEATDEFRKAVEIRPGAQSARLATAAFHYLANRPGDAARQVDPVLSSQPDVEDPWPSYLAPGHRDWPMRLQAKRFAASTTWGYPHPSTHSTRAGGPGVRGQDPRDC